MFVVRGVLIIFCFPVHPVVMPSRLSHVVQLSVSSLPGLSSLGAISCTLQTALVRLFLCANAALSMPCVSFHVLLVGLIGRL